jgi:hypothetical protein
LYQQKGAGDFALATELRPFPHSARDACVMTTLSIRDQQIGRVIPYARANEDKQFA